MGKFTYTARDKKGERIEGALEVEDRQAVIQHLQTMGYFPVKIEDVTPKSRQSMTLSALRGKIKSTDMVNFHRQLSDLVSAGVPLVRSLGIILSQIKDEQLHKVISDISKSVQGGDTLAQAMQRHPKVFNKLNIAMVKAGEAGGMLDDVLSRLADFSEAEEALKGKILASLAYPAVMIVAGVIVVSILLVVVIPKITGVYTNMGQELPEITKLLIFITDSLRTYFWLIGLVLGTVIFLAKQFLASKEGKLLYHAFLFKIPILGEVIKKRELSIFARTLGNLLRNGVPILQSIEITEEVVSNQMVARDVRKLVPAISQGSSMANVMGDSDVFPGIMTSMVAVGEETAQIDRVLVRLSDTYEAEVERSLKALTAMIEPLIMLALGLVVGFVVIAMLLPIMSMDPTGESS